MFNERFSVAPTEPGHAFLPVRGKDLDLIFSLQHERSVNQDNTVHFGSRVLQIEKTRWRVTLAGCRVTIYEHLDGSCTIGYGPHIVGRYHRDGLARLLESPAPPHTQHHKPTPNTQTNRTLHVL